MNALTECMIGFETPAAAAAAWLAREEAARPGLMDARVPDGHRCGISAESARCGAMADAAQTLLYLEHLADWESIQAEEESFHGCVPARLAGGQWYLQPRDPHAWQYALS